MRKCMESERENIYRYIASEPEMNLFFYGDIESYGLSSSQVEVYAEDNDSGTYDSLILRYFDFYIIYSQSENYALEPVLDFFQNRENIDSISGKIELLKPLAPHLPQFKMTADYMCRCNSISPVTTSGVNLKKLAPENARDIVELYLKIEEFASNYRGKEDKMAEQLKVSLGDGGIAWGIFDNSQLISVGSTGGANSKSAMVIGIATHPDYRKRGYASTIVQKLCQESFEQGKEFLCLFYHNPHAGRIYRKIGFEEIGQYATLRA